MFYDVYAELCRKTGEKPYVVASMVGAKSNSSVASWQRGSIPRQPILQRIADHFGVSIDYLLTGEEKQPTVSGELSEDEVKLLEAYRAVADQKKEIYLQILTQAAEQTP